MSSRLKTQGMAWTEYKVLDMATEAPQRSCLMELQAITGWLGLGAG